MSKGNGILLETGTNELEVIEFGIQYKAPDGTITSQSLGINVTKVREIVRMSTVTVVPETRPGVRGMITLRNQVMPVVDLGYHLYGNTSIGDGQLLIISEFNSIRLALVVDSVSRIHRISWTDVRPPTAIQDIDPENATITGIVVMGEKNLMMVDVERIIAKLEPRLAMEDVAIEARELDRPLKVLMAEDSETIRRMLFSKLQEAGFDIISTHNGLEAWHQLEAAQTTAKPVDLVISDIEMPQMDGYTLVRKIKEHPQHADTPVILFSSMISQDNYHKGASVGADAQLTKPMVGELISTIYNLVPMAKAA